MPGCQAVKANGKHCRNYARKGKTCCYAHRYLENVPAEIEEPVCKPCSSETKECELWGPPEITETEDEIVGEVQEMKSMWPWKRSDDDSDSDFEPGDE